MPANGAKPEAKKVPDVKTLMAALQAEAEGLQKIHIAVGNQIARLQVRDRAVESGLPQV